MKKLNDCKKIKCFVWKWQHFQYELILLLLLLNSLFKFGIAITFCNYKNPVFVNLTTKCGTNSVSK